MPRSSVAAAVTIPEGKTLEDVMSAVQTAAAEMFPRDQYAWVEATQDGFCIIRNGEDLTRHAWSIDADGVVTIEREGAAVKRVVQYEKVTASFTFAALRGSVGRKFDIRVIGTGPGLNQDRFGPWFVEDSDEGIGSARKVFGGARVYWHQVDGGAFDHLDADSRTWLGSNRDAGYLSDLRTTADGLFASLNVDDDVPEAIVEALRSRALGFSVECEADRHPIVRGGKSFSALRNFRHPSDGQARVAIVSHPALRGEVIRLAASRKKENTVDENTGTAVADPKAEMDKVLASAKAELDAQLERARKAAEESEQRNKAARVAEVRASVTAKLQAARLPDASRDVVLDVFAAKIASGEQPTDEEIQAQVDRQRKLIAPRDAVVAGLGGEVQVGFEARDRHRLLLDRMLLGNQLSDRHREVEKILASDYGKSTLAEAERAMGLPVAPLIGPRRVFGLISGHDPVEWRSGDRARRATVRASYDATNLDDTFADRMHKVMLAYSVTNEWRMKIGQIARIINVNDFRNVDFVHRGLYGTLPQVAKRQNYTALSSPTDRGHEFAVAKYGGTEDTAWEDIVNDDRNAIADLPMMLVDAYWYTQGTDVANLFLQTNLSTGTGPDYDSGTPYTDASRSNEGTTAFSDTELNVVWKAMQKQTDFFSSRRLHLVPKRLLHPVDLAKTVNDVLKPSGSADAPGNTTDYSFARSIGLVPVLMPHWTNTGDHVYITDPAVFPSAVVAYLNGQAEPTIDVQDNRTVGSWFDQDVMTWKISGVWGRDLVRHEGIYLEDV